MFCPPRRAHPQQTKQFCIRDRATNTPLTTVIDYFHQPPGDILTESPVFIGKADALVVVYAVDNRESFANVENWVYFGERFSTPLVRFIVGTKSDAAPRAVEKAEGVALAKRLGTSYYEVSARTGRNVDEFFGALSVVHAAADAPGAVLID